MKNPITFKIEGKLGGGRLGRAGVLSTPHGDIQTPAFVTVGTKGTVKGITPEQLASLGAQVVLANTYHLFLQPGDEIVRDAGGLHAFMNWQRPTMTDSGGFQVFSLGAAYGKEISKITKETDPQLLLSEGTPDPDSPKLAKIDADGVTFKSHLNGDMHYITPEKSIGIQHNLGADMIFAFDECTSPVEPIHYQKEALERTHRWAKRSLAFHLDAKLPSGERIAERQALFGIVQGGRHEELRKESAEILAGMDFDGYGIGGSFAKEDMSTAVKWVNGILPEEKPRHLLGIGEPLDLFMGAENGVDLFDCVAPTRLGRTGTVYTRDGRLNLLKAACVGDFSKIDDDCDCYACRNYTRAYLSHLFRAKEMLGPLLGSIHNLRFTIRLVERIRQGILDGSFDSFKEEFLGRYYR